MWLIRIVVFYFVPSIARIIWVYYLFILFFFWFELGLVLLGGVVRVGSSSSKDIFWRLWFFSYYLTFGFKTVIFLNTYVRFSIKCPCFCVSKSFINKVLLMDRKLSLLPSISELLCTPGGLFKQQYIIVQIGVHTWHHSLIIWIILRD